MAEHVRVEATAGSRDEAQALAASVVTARLVACAQVSGPIASSYRWRGAVETDEEWLLVCKTAADRLGALVEHLRAEHSYDVPEIIAVPITGGNPDYLTWLTDETREDAG